ncbi:putative methyltransferase PMT9 [Platanthera guangdongensis]|uniref:Methyltransferase n=1 Tax=Platanthera guangdongensis TaxID=2320717 RepID=A0ABR2LUD5_9ASPA
MKQLQLQQLSRRCGVLFSRRLFFYLLISLVVSLSLVVVYYGASFAPGLRLSDDSVTEGSDPVFLPLVHSFDLSTVSSPDPYFLNSFPVCDQRFSELIPCMDRNLIYQLKMKLNLSVMEHYERHCPPPNRRYNCLIPPPPGYRIPIRWPQSRDEVWRMNIPHTHLAFDKSDQHWMVVRGDKINFPGGGTHFHTGADKYIAHIAQMLKFPSGNLSKGGNIRTVLDVGCGVASFGAYLLTIDIIAMSLAPNDVHENQIQFALERGIPSTLGVLGTKRLPYPSRSFDLAHCSRCRIDWIQRDGILLLELDRILRPGGYFVYSSPEAYALDEKNQRIWNAMSDLVRKMCWKIASKKNQTVIWVKPLSNGCFSRRDSGVQPPLCSSEDDPDAVWNVAMKACIFPYSKRVNRAKGSELVPWPRRLTAPPPRLEEIGVSSEKYHEDNEIWHWRVIQYWKYLGSEVDNNSFRNVMDMGANLGGFAAALENKDAWVMNVIPVNESSKLKIIYDRGLIGTIHDWCESFSTYPRTYELLHAWFVFSHVELQGCSLEDLLIEMDRILRPHGFVIIRDRPHVVTYVRRYLKALKWDAWSFEFEPGADSLSSGEERVLLARKRLWTDNSASL